MRVYNMNRKQKTLLTRLGYNCKQFWLVQESPDSLTLQNKETGEKVTVSKEGVKK